MPDDRVIPDEGTNSTVTTKIKVDGNDIPGSFEVLNVTVNKEVYRISSAKISILDGGSSEEDFAISNEDLFIPGKELEIMAGYEANEDTIFKGIITKHGLKIRSDGTSLLRIECRDKVFKTTQIRKNRYFLDVKDSAAFEEILGEYDFDPDIESSDLEHKELVQYELTDWDFIVSRAEAIGKICIVDDGAFKIAKPDFTQDSTLTLIYGATLLEFDGEIDARLQYSGVKGYSWDYANQELLEAEAEDPGIEGGGNLSATDLAGIGDESTYTLKHSGQVVQDELQEWANAQLLKTRLTKVRGRAKFQGFAAIKPGNLITLQGVGDRFNGLIYVSGIFHEISNGEWNTHAQLGLSEDWISEKPGFTPKPAGGLSSGIPGLQIGIVTQLQEDPDGEHRILVKLPILDPEADGVWARMSTLDSGDTQGFFFLPDIDSEVIVGFINGDPRDPVVIGTLNSSAKPAPIEATDDNFEKGIVTKNELKFLLDIDKKIILLESPAGKKITLDEDQGVLQLEDENDNKIVLDSDGILIESGSDIVLKAGGKIGGESGADIELKAGGSFKAEGSSGAEVTTGAIAKLEGSLVQIN